MVTTEQIPIISMNLPTPTDREVQEFAALYERKFGVVLGEKEAWEAATRTLQLFYLGTYGLKTQAPPDHKTAPLPTTNAA